MNEQTQTNTGPKPDDLQRQYFAPTQQADAEKAVEMARGVCESHSLPLVLNFDMANGLPDGYGVAVIPITQTRSDEGRVTIGCLIGAIPDPETILAHEKGEAWARKVMTERCMAKLANTARPKKKADGDDTGPASLPFSVEDFIIEQQRESGLAFFREVKKGYIAGLQGMGFKTMNDKTFREVLSSKQMATQHFARVPQATWENLLRKMISRAEAAGKDPGTLRVWLETRDTTTVSLPDDFDVAELDALADAELAESEAE